MQPCAYLYDDIYLKHDTGSGHPERPERLTAIDKRIRSLPFYDNLVKIEKNKALIECIELIHDKDYINRIKSEIESGTVYLDSMDTVVCRDSFEVALYAAGGCMNMCDTVMDKKAYTGFCAIRPPGHHAERAQAAGFCIFNNIAICAKYLQKEYDLKRVAIVDWDVHHGNGTQHSFEMDPSVYYISTHQYPHYPGTGDLNERGIGAGKGFNLNIPMQAGSSDRDYIEAFESTIIPELDRYSPEIILISAGFDAHNLDPLSSIHLSSESYYTFTKMLLNIAEKHSGNRLIAFLEGGYDLDALAEGVEMVFKAFME
ncbi:MAG: histone deacetylase [Spirochaetes bacterium]|nr:histone deacetylase [Spirochaetota bacterium]